MLVITKATFLTLKKKKIKLKRKKEKKRGQRRAGTRVFWLVFSIYSFLSNAQELSKPCKHYGNFLE